MVHAVGECVCVVKLYACLCFMLALKCVVCACICAWNIMCLAFASYVCAFSWPRYTIMDVLVTLKLAEAELLEISGEWRTIGCNLGVGDLHIIGANHGKYSERCLSEVLGSWIKNERNPSWSKLCNALENAGLRSKAKKVREKYSSPSTLSTPGTRRAYFAL